MRCVDVGVGCLVSDMGDGAVASSVHCTVHCPYPHCCSYGASHDRRRRRSPRPSAASSASTAQRSAGGGGHITGGSTRSADDCEGRECGRRASSSSLSHSAHSAKRRHLVPAPTAERETTSCTRHPLASSPPWTDGQGEVEYAEPNRRTDDAATTTVLWTTPRSPYRLTTTSPAVLAVCVLCSSALCASLLAITTAAVCASLAHPAAQHCSFSPPSHCVWRHWTRRR